MTSGRKNLEQIIAESIKNAAEEEEAYYAKATELGISRDRANKAVQESIAGAAAGIGSLNVYDVALQRLRQDLG
jgi:hypothetical protein